MCLSREYASYVAKVVTAQRFSCFENACASAGFPQKPVFDPPRARRVDRRVAHVFERQRLEATSYPLGAQRVSALPWLNHRPWLDGSLSV